MSNIFEELYKGNIGFDSWNYGKESPFVKAAKKKLDNMTALTATLDDSQKKLLDGYVEAQGDIEAITRYDSNRIKIGITIGLQIKLLYKFSCSVRDSPCIGRVYKSNSVIACRQ